MAFSYKCFHNLEKKKIFSRIFLSFTSIIHIRGTRFLSENNQYQSSLPAVQTTLILCLFGNKISNLEQHLCG